MLQYLQGDVYEKNSMDTPMYLNLASKQNGLPVLLSTEQYITAYEQKALNDSDIIWLDHNFWTNETISPEAYDQLQYVSILENAGITREEYLQARKQNYEQQMQSFFENSAFLNLSQN